MCKTALLSTMTRMKNNKLYMWLAYAGALPFIFCAVLITAGYSHAYMVGELSTIISSYSLVIVVFMAGIYWGLHFSQNHVTTINLLLISNIIAILTWLAYLIINMPLTLLMYSAVFVLLLIIDYRLLRYNLISKEYFSTRCIVSAVVISCLLISYFSITGE